MDNKIKAFFKTIFSVNFLLKILLITAIILMLQFIERGGIYISIYVSHSGNVGLKNQTSDSVFKIRQFNVDVPSR